MRLVTAGDANHRTWQDWSCTVRVVADSPRDADDAAVAVRELMESVAAAVSRFRPDSELSRCNAHAGRPVLVGRLTAELIQTSLSVARETDGLVDPTVGRHVVAAGYDCDIAQLRRREHGAEQPDDIEARTPRPARPRWSEVELHEGSGLVVVPSGRALDLGATAKAWTVDRAVQTVAQLSPGRVLVEIGGDVAVARAEDRPFVVRVAEREGERGELVALSHGALATSTTQARRWQRGSEQAHHLIDPRTGRPAMGAWRTVTAWAPSTVEANSASTAAVVAGDDAKAWLSARGRAARLVDQHGVVSYLGAWPTTEDGAA